MWSPFSGDSFSMLEYPNFINVKLIRNFIKLIANFATRYINKLLGVGQHLILNLFTFLRCLNILSGYYSSFVLFPDSEFVYSFEYFARFHLKLCKIFKNINKLRIGGRLSKLDIPLKFCLGFYTTPIKITRNLYF